MSIGARTAVSGILERGRQATQAYSPDEQRPLRGYVGALSTYAGVVTAIGVAVRASGKVSTKTTPWDVALLGVATHRLSRTLTKDAVTSPLRAPFTQYVEPGAPSELNEQVRVHGGVKHAVGELLTCPFCLAQWVATTLMAGHLLAPRATRAVTATMSAVAISDFLQYAYEAVHQAAEG